ncbi:tRNA (adenosine(37)-N6)-threonylcarbamoyltransferase complex ATPase subunit type 1 TsaE [Hugenholtzia roseola]|uniref:tRNA (adenosine(37)-N6)-threonylcarbamoyltransferase complex ATPase subunit type 1 TsaE n=1 Tax=Hugenholtzia roseola TaxID=1002 RepID=UPI00041F92FC|nr:tRNA (adenosine(37)-N6)-threonylcarbamoyltransferase complex ATPase subunit type 1 TsaE [Hugenholtzia roseola]
MESLPITYTWQVPTLAAWDEVAAQALAKFGNTPIWIFEGNLGAGKTTFIKALARKMGISDLVSSPTFALVQSYLLPNKRELYHFDLYRLESLEQALDIGIEEYFDSGAICWIEWAQIVVSLLPKPYIVVSILPSPDSPLRTVTLTRHE